MMIPNTAPTPPWWWPYAKVVASTIGALVVALVVVMASDGIPATAQGWVEVLAKILGPAAGAAVFGWAKPETRSQ